MIISAIYWLNAGWQHLLSTSHCATMGQGREDSLDRNSVFKNGGKSNFYEIIKNSNTERVCHDIKELLLIRGDVGIVVMLKYPYLLEIWPSGQIQSTICFYMACELRIVYTFFKWLKESKQKYLMS